MDKPPKHIQERLQDLPNKPGVYFHKNKTGDIIYIGKAANLNSRVRHYFQKNRYRDTKTDVLVSEIADIEWTETGTELDALFLEAELVRRYQPKYNILLRDDKSLVYVRVSYNSDHPTVTLTRRPLDDGARYFGPYASATTVRRALALLRKAFPFSTHNGAVPTRACLHVQLGLCPGLEAGHTSLATYRKQLQRLMRYLRGGRTELMKQLEADMKQAANKQDYETAATIRNQLQTLRQLGAEIVFSDKESLDISKDMGLAGLAELLGLTVALERIEGFDISHMHGSDTVASMVVFANGIPQKSSYRKFKMRVPGNDDFIHMHEVIYRRLAAAKLKSWGSPSLCIIDGGKGQLTAALRARDERGVNVPMIGLAKRYEQIVIHKQDSGASVESEALEQYNAHVDQTGDFLLITLPESSHIVKLLQRIRDESHRFAVSYHSVLKQKRTAVSVLDEIPGVGAVTKKKLLRAFGSVRALEQASTDDVAAIVGQKKAATIRRHIAANQQ